MYKQEIIFLNICNDPKKQAVRTFGHSGKTLKGQKPKEKSCLLQPICTTERYYHVTPSIDAHIIQVRGSAVCLVSLSSFQVVPFLTLNGSDTASFSDFEAFMPSYLEGFFG